MSASERDHPDCWPEPWIPAKRDDVYIHADPTLGEDFVVLGSCDSLEASLYIGEFISTDTMWEIEQ